MAGEAVRAREPGDAAGVPDDRRGNELCTMLNDLGWRAEVRQLSRGLFSLEATVVDSPAAFAVMMLP